MSISVLSHPLLRLRNVGVDPGRTRNSDIYERLRADILHCRLQPGERLRFDELRRRFQAGIGSLREALMRLASEGLVVLEEHKGFAVAPVSRDELTDITETRRELEALAIRLAIQKGNDQWESAIAARFHELAKCNMAAGSDTLLDPEWEARHQAFHFALYAACGSAWLIYFCQLLFDQSDRYRRLWFRTNPERRTRDVSGEHRELMDAVLARDAASATYLIQRHIGRTAAALLADMGEVPAPNDTRN